VGVARESQKNFRASIYRAQWRIARHLCDSTAFLYLKNKKNMHTVMQLVVEAVAVDGDVDAGAHAGADTDVGVDAEAAVEVEVVQRQRTGCRNIDWHCRFCPTTPGVLQQHRCYLKSRIHYSNISILLQTGSVTRSPTSLEHKKTDSETCHPFVCEVADLFKTRLENWLSQRQFYPRHSNTNVIKS